MPAENTESSIITDIVKRLIDSHSHIFVQEFNNDLDAVVERARSVGVDTFLMPNINVESYTDVLRVCNCYPGYCHPMIGLHPTDLTENWKEDLDYLKALLDKDRSGDCRIVGIGETGLDLYWEQDGLATQLAAFECQIEWALEYDLPLVIHSRSAFSELCAIMDRYAKTHLRGVFHCFSGGPDEAARLMEYKGFYFGIGGTVTYKKSVLPESLGLIPLTRVLTETDCPYLSPVPYRGSRNEPSYIIKVVEKLAGIYNLSVDEVAETTCQNAVNLFGIN